MTVRLRAGKLLEVCERPTVGELIGFEHNTVQFYSNNYNTDKVKNLHAPSATSFPTLTCKRPSMIMSSPRDNANAEAGTVEHCDASIETCMRLAQFGALHEHHDDIFKEEDWKYIARSLSVPHALILTRVPGYPLAAVLSKSWRLLNKNLPKQQLLRECRQALMLESKLESQSDTDCVDESDDNNDDNDDDDDKRTSMMRGWAKSLSESQIQLSSAVKRLQLQMKKMHDLQMKKMQTLEQELKTLARSARIKSRDTVKAQATKKKKRKRDQPTTGASAKAKKPKQ
jgi:hypothetical protein